MHFLQDIQLPGKKVLVRLDLDLPKSGRSFDETRLEDGVATLRYLFAHKVKSVSVIAHRGRPKGESPAYSLAPIEKLLRAKLTKEENALLEVKKNLRFDPREEKGSVVFAKSLAKGFDLYVMDAFATAHREHTSITFIPDILPTVPGVQFAKELKAFGYVLGKPKRPFLVVLGGAKLETKIPLIQAFENRTDVILVGGKLALEAREQGLSGRKLIIAELTKDGKDISQPAIDQFIRFIKAAGTIVWNGPMGMFEDGKHSHGTKQIAIAINEAHAYTLTGGGDTESAQTKYHAEDKIDHISSGGGSMLEYLIRGTLPGVEAITKSQEKFKV
ncbi:MAG TPA: phosphoglycerate kinase [Patescibacteria group bacterium]|nr:phosphoglycerate kinase [Patescibacteria group bacterium]